VMKKKDFVTMLTGTISGFFFSIGMCMALLPEWHLMVPGIFLIAIGGVGAIVALLIRRKMSGLSLWQWNTRIVLNSVFGIVGFLAFSLGMVMSMVWHLMLFGIILGLIGIIMLVTLIPLIKGFEDDADR
jgi:hypothetical protein